MSQPDKKNKRRVVMVIGLIGISAMVYTAISYQTKHNHRTLRGTQPVGEAQSQVGEPDSSQANQTSQGAPSLPADARIPSNIPPAMLKAMQERGMSVDQLRGSGKGSSTMSGMAGANNPMDTNTSMANDGQFPEAMQKALAERNAQKAQGTQSANNNTTAPARMGMQSANTNQFPAYIYQGVTHMKSHKNKPLIARMDSYMNTLSQNPNDVQALMDLSQIFQEHGMEGSKYLLQRATTTAPSNPKVAHLYGIALSKSFDSEEAAKQMERSLGLEDNPLVRYDIALLYRYQLNQPKLAKEYLEQALTAKNLDPSLKDQIQRELKR